MVLRQILHTVNTTAGAITTVHAATMTKSLSAASREKVYSPQYNNTAVKTVINNTKWGGGCQKDTVPSYLATYTKQ